MVYDHVKRLLLHVYGITLCGCVWGTVICKYRTSYWQSSHKGTCAAYNIPLYFSSNEKYFPNETEFNAFLLTLLSCVLFTDIYVKVPNFNLKEFPLKKMEQLSKFYACIVAWSFNTAWVE